MEITELRSKMETLAKENGFAVIYSEGELTGPFDPYGFEREIKVNPKSIRWEWTIRITVRAP